MKADLEAARAQARDQARSLSSQAKAEAQAHADQLAKQLQAEEAKVQQQVSTEISEVKTAANTANAKIADVSTDVGGVKTQVSADAGGIAEDDRRSEERAGRPRRAERPDRHQRAGTAGAEAPGRAQLLRVQARQDRKRRSGSATSRLLLKKTDPKKNKYTVDVMADDKLTEKKDKNVNEPVQFYSSKARQPYEIVVNQVQKDLIVGYLATPKEQAAR